MDWKSKSLNTCATKFILLWNVFWKREKYLHHDTWLWPACPARPPGSSALTEASWPSVVCCHPKFCFLSPLRWWWGDWPQGSSQILATCLIIYTFTPDPLVQIHTISKSFRFKFINLPLAHNFLCRYMYIIMYANIFKTESRYVDMYFRPWIRSCYCHLESYFSFTTETFPPRWHSWHQNWACSKRSSRVCVSGVRSSFTTAFVIFNLSCSIMFVIEQPLCINSKHWTQHIAHSCHPIKV